MGSRAITDGDDSRDDDAYDQLIWIAGILIEAGANPDRPNDAGYSARDVAPDLMRHHCLQQTKRVREHLSLAAFIKGLIPKAGATLPTFLVSNWEAANVTELAGS